MIRLNLSRTVLGTCLMLATLGPLACSDDTAADAASIEAGSMSLPLTTVAGGHTYRLSNASLVIYGPTNTSLFSSDDPAETVLSTPLLTGDYSAYLYSWSLERDDGAGNFAPVPATLLSSYYQYFTIFNGATTTVSYEFETDGVIVRVGAGELQVVIAVQENPAVCEPFGDACAAGSWCPPTGLTGRERGCMTEGPVPVGERCAGPADCVANASCFDFGSGPECAALCPSSDFDDACSAGGMCVGIDAEYGICTPVAQAGPSTAAEPEPNAGEGLILE